MKRKRYVSAKIIDGNTEAIITFILKARIVGIFPFKEFYETVKENLGIPSGYELLEDIPFYFDNHRSDIVIPFTTEKKNTWVLFKDSETGCSRDIRRVQAFYVIKDNGCVLLKTKYKFHIYKGNNTIEVYSVTNGDTHFVKIRPDLTVEESF